ncbi:MAG: phosphoglucosamine mutase [Gemmatimonadaceae bacterium]|nr:phosphoglucosamine mutase [Gemmatimonadaceae bacterium]
MVSVSGIRGRVGAGLTPEVVATYAAGFGAWSIARSSSRDIVVGRDSRVSGPLFHRIVLSALESVGCRVIDIGMAPTPTVQLAVEHHHAAGGLAITASHNPVEWNALKFIGSSGLFLDGDEAAAMRAFTDAGIPRAAWDALGDVRQDSDAVSRHLAAVLALPYVDVPRIRARKFRVVLDTCRGAGSVIMPQLLDALGCEVRHLEPEPDGRFPRSPEPIAENLGALEAAVREFKADVGIATDPDVDRLAIVSDAGRAIGEDLTLALAARLVLRTTPGVVVTNLSTSRILDDVAEAAGQRVERAPVGEVNVAVAMRRLQSPIGGEGNGGVILPALHLGRDGPVAAALLLQLLVEDGTPLSAIVASLPKYAIVKDKLDRPSKPLTAVYEALTAAFAGAEVDLQDGLRLAWPDRWLHVRPSGTEPIVRVIAEAPTDADARALVARAREPLDALAAT